MTSEAALSQDPSLGLWLGRPAPRYTSYPPATCFVPVSDAGEAPHIAVLREAQAPISIYVHIPFCRELCLFCGCHSIITKRPERTTAYLFALHWEIADMAKRLGRRLKVAHLHFGGGSPSTLLPEQFKALMAELRQHFDFTADAELAIELDPRTTSPELVQTLAAEGINRASLGVQDFRPEVQALIHRIQPYALVEKVMNGLREAGIQAVSVDLMYGLPAQSPDSVAHTAQQVLGLDPSRISLFSYAHVPGMKPYQKKLEQAGLPDDLTRLAQEQAARQVLEGAGYVAIGIDHFAKPTDKLAMALCEGRLSRNFQGYTDDPASLLLGFGASAISDVGTLYVQNEPDLEAYQQAVVGHRSPLKRQCVRHAEDNVRGAIISALMCNFAVNLAAYPGDYSAEKARLAPFVEGGLVTLNGDLVTVATRHRMAVRAVAAVFDTYFNASQISSRVA